MDSKRKRIVSAMLLMTMSTNIFSTNVFAGGNASVVTGNHGNNNRTGQTPTTPSSFVVNGSGNNVINGSGNNVVINQIQTQEGHLIIGKEIENKKITDIVSIPKDEIKSVTIKDGVTSISDSAFEGCTGLTSITIPSSVISIGKYAFQNCPSLKQIYIPNSVTSIGKSAFHSCTDLTSITIPNSVISIGEFTFQKCTSLKQIHIPSSVKEIGKYAFSQCPNLISASISNNVKTINEGVFWQCPNLTSVTIPNSVTSIEKFAFNECTSLTSVTIPNSVTSIGEDAFDNEVHIKKYSAHTNSTTQPVNKPNNAFDNEPDKTTFKDGHLFVGKEIENKKITDIVSIPKDEIKSVTIKDGVTSISDSAFEGCTGLTSITIPSSVISIGKYAFQNCPSLKQIYIPKSVTSIGSSAFLGCTGLTSINVDEGNPEYKSVDGVLFSKDGTELIQYPASKNETNYFIPSSVTDIASCAFYGCARLQEVTVRNSVKKIGWNAFGICGNLTSINVNIRNKYYEDIDGVLFSKDGKKLIQYPAGKQATNYIIPNSVTEIGEWAFVACTSLKEITIPDSVTDIGGVAFYGCIGLTSITIPDSVTSIGDGAFKDCTGLKEVTVPKSAKIADDAFDKNTTVHRI